MQPQWLYSLVLISVFVLCELVPYSIALGADLGSLLAGAPSVAPRPNDATHSAVTVSAPPPTPFRPVPRK